MKKLLFVFGLAAISLVACKKETISTPEMEGVDVVATKVGAFKNEQEAPKLWFTGNFKQLMMSLANGGGVCQMGKCFCTEFSFKLTTPSGTTITSELTKLGNSPNYRSGNLNIPGNLKFQLVDIAIIDCDGEEFYNGQIFVYQSGQTAVQNPKVANIEKIGQWTHSNGVEYVETLVVTISGDPAQQIDRLRFVPDPIRVETGDPRNPFEIVQLPSLDLEKTHFNQSTGIACFSSMDNIRTAYSDSFEYSISDGDILSGSIYSMNKGDLIDRIVEKASLKKASSL